jgi:maltooligosyltrehalose trehalohydrolase
MTTFRVWAPIPTKVEVQIEAERIPMTGKEGSWWSIDLPAVGPGTDYAFVLDNEGPLPDPRSPWQPAGIHGPSRVVDHRMFPWTDKHWQAKPLTAAVIYELHIGTFTPEGTFAAAIEKLPHLVDLGITHVEVMPVNEFSGRWGWGYDGVDLYAPHHVYGGPDGFKHFVDACHRHGLAVLLDVVYNHLGPAGNYLNRFGPYFTTRHATPWGHAVNLDGPGSDEVRRFFCENALMWLRDYHCDGLRLDAVHALVDTSAVHFLEQLATEVDALAAHLGRHLVLIAESDLNDPRIVRPRAVGGYGIGAQWSDDFHHALHAVLTGERSGYYTDFGSLAAFAKALKSVFVYDGCYSTFRGRRHGRQIGELSGRHFLSYLQNHDQVGNRAQGERSSHLLNPGQLQVAAALVLTAPFIPMLFQGEEWGASAPFLYFTQHEDPELGQAVSRGRREEFAAFGWDPDGVPDPQAPETFLRSKLAWGERNREPHARLLAWHQALIRLRRNVPTLTDGQLARVQVQYDGAALWLVLTRAPITVACNFGPQCQRVPLHIDVLRDLLLASRPEVQVDYESVHLPPYSVALFGPRELAQLVREVDHPVEVHSGSQSREPSITVSGAWEQMFEGDGRSLLETPLAQYLPQCRWFGGKARQMRSLTVSEIVRFFYDSRVAYWTFVKVEYGETAAETYLLPLTVTCGPQAQKLQGKPSQNVIARVQNNAQEAFLREAIWEEGFGEALLDAVARGARLPGLSGALRAAPTRVFPQLRGPSETGFTASPMSGEQSNTSIAFGERLILKLFRRMTDGVNPDLEITRFLTERTSFRHIARVAGTIEYDQAQSEPCTVAILQEFVPNQGDAWQYTRTALKQYFDAIRLRRATLPTGGIPAGPLLPLSEEQIPEPVRDLIGPYTSSAALLGQRTAELHLALASDREDPQFAPEPFSAAYRQTLFRAIHNLATQSFELLRQRLSDLPAVIREEAQHTLSLEHKLLDYVRSLSRHPLTAQVTRHHGDYHLGQVLYTGTDFVIIDFEGEPARSLQERRQKHSPLRDVAGMLRSFHYAAYASLFEQAGNDKQDGQAGGPSVSLEPWAQAWYRWVSAVFAQHYLGTAGEATFLPRAHEDLRGLLDIYLLEKAVYELNYELNNRPGWVRIPLQGITQFVGTAG